MQQIIGTIVKKDAEVRTTETGRKLVTFTLLVVKKIKTKEGEKRDRLTYFDCVLWNRDKAAPHLTRGTTLLMDGEARAEAYLDAEGNPKAKLKFVIDNFTFQPSRRPAVNESNAITQTNTNAPVSVSDNDDLPF